jgi:hypothetical protein
VPGAEDEIPAGHMENSTLLGVFGYWVEEFDEIVRTTLLSIEKVKASGFQSIWMIFSKASS